MTIDVTPDSATLRVGGGAAAARGAATGGTAAGPVAGAPGYARAQTEVEDTVYRFSSRKELRSQTWDCGI